ncbi:hypothetical protein FQA39_LY19283 [Lamprigera yunnana]|nr:hypothetical protein FQA39_LY19283 [Lamprigera yunnana]
MASALTDKLSRLVKEMRGQARITESNVQDMLREVRMALLEADVALPVVRDFIARVKEKALGQEVLGSLKPGQTLVSIVNKELASTMGEGVADINLNAQPPAVILMAGLQGAGKTTTTAKLAKHLIEKRKKKVLTVSGDVYRPAAIEQLKTVTKQAGAEWFPSTVDQKPLDIANAALDYAKKHYFDVLLVDTAGRLAIDEVLMNEIQQLHGALKPVWLSVIVTSIKLPDQPRIAGEVHHPVAFGAAHQLAAVAFAGAFQQQALHRAHALFADVFDVLVDDGLQRLQAAQLHVVRCVVGQIGGGRAGAGAEDKAEAVVKAHIVDELHHLLKVLLRLAGKADDEVAAHRKSGELARSLRMVLLYSMAV